MNGDPSILIRHTPDRQITVVSLYINNFFFALNHFIILDILKKVLGQKYNIKDLGEVQTIIRWQIIENPTTHILKIDQEAFV